MKVFAKIFFFLLCPCVLFAQSYIELPTAYIRNELYGNNKLPANVQGSPFYDESFKPSVITIGNNTFNSQARYNALIDVFEIKNPEGEVVQLQRRSDMRVEMDGRNHIFLNYRDDRDQLKEHYFEVLEKGTYGLLKLKQVIFHEAKSAKSSYSREKPARLEQDTKYYLQKEDLHPQEIRLNKKDILKEINDPEANRIISENKWKLKEEEEVRALIAALNKASL